MLTVLVILVEKLHLDTDITLKRKKNKYNITSGFIICWIVVLKINGAHFGAEKRGTRKLWCRNLYGLSFPYIQNTMTIKSFKFM